MGAHTLLRFALQHPERVAGLAVITPAYDGAGALSEARLARWDRLAAGLRVGGIEGGLSTHMGTQVSTQSSWRDRDHRHPPTAGSA